MNYDEVIKQVFISVDNVPSRVRYENGTSAPTTLNIFWNDV